MSKRLLEWVRWGMWPAADARASLGERVLLDTAFPGCDGTIPGWVIVAVMGAPTAALIVAAGDALERAVLDVLCGKGGAA